MARLSEKPRIPVGELAGYGAREQAHAGHPREVAQYRGRRPDDLTTGQLSDATWSQRTSFSRSSTQ